MNNLLKLLPIGVTTPCAGKDDIFLSEKIADIRQAKALCNTCPLRLDCAEEYKDEVFGTFGGFYRNRTLPGKSRATAIREERIELAAKLHSQGLSTLNIADAIHETPRVVRGFLKIKGLTPNPPVQKSVQFPLSVEEGWQIARYTEEKVWQRRVARGMTVEQMAAADDRKVAYALAQLQKFGLTAKRKWEVEESE